MRLFVQVFRVLGFLTPLAAWRQPRLRGMIFGMIFGVCDIPGHEQHRSGKPVYLPLGLGERVVEFIL